MYFVWCCEGFVCRQYSVCCKLEKNTILCSTTFVVFFFFFMSVSKETKTMCLWTVRVYFKMYIFSRFYGQVNLWDSPVELTKGKDGTCFTQERELQWYEFSLSPLVMWRRMIAISFSVSAFFSSFFSCLFSTHNVRVCVFRSLSALRQHARWLRCTCNNQVSRNRRQQFPDIYL